jgi:hypothetical protein
MRNYGSGLNEMFTNCPEEYITIMGYVDGLCYYDAPQYVIVKGAFIFSSFMRKSHLTDNFLN